MVLPIHLLKLDPFPLYSRLLRYRVYSRQGYEKLRHDVPRQNYHAHVKVPPVVVVVFGGHEAAIDHGKIDGVLHLAHFRPREIVRETRSGCHRPVSLLPPPRRMSPLCVFARARPTHTDFFNSKLSVAFLLFWLVVEVPLTKRALRKGGVSFDCCDDDTNDD